VLGKTQWSLSGGGTGVVCARVQNFSGFEIEWLATIYMTGSFSINALIHRAFRPRHCAPTRRWSA
jgi:hypothetical protein